VNWKSGNMTKLEGTMVFNISAVYKKKALNIGRPAVTGA
jgi:hypothetical protein